jgi:hypothetical protein
MADREPESRYLQLDVPVSADFDSPFVSLHVAIDPTSGCYDSGTWDSPPLPTSLLYGYALPRNPMVSVAIVVVVSYRNALSLHMRWQAARGPTFHNSTTPHFTPLSTAPKVSG